MNRKFTVLNEKLSSWYSTYPREFYIYIKQIAHQGFNNHVSQCIICKESSHIHQQLCEHCLKCLPLFNMQQVNGDLLNWPGVNQLFNHRFFDHLISVTPYSWPLSKWIQALKFERNFTFAQLLSFIMLQQWQTVNANLPPVHFALSIPTYIKKWQQRGFNQSHLIAKAFAEKAQLEYCPNILTRVRQNKSQVGQGGSQRRKSLQGNFTITSIENLKGKHVLLIDDVITTGSTVNEVSRVLKRAGVHKITVFTLCLSLDKC